MKNIMIAEDSSVMQNLTKKILETQNFKIFTVKNGHDVLKQFEKHDFDLILMDINMPKMNGMDCAKAIRQLKDEKKSKIPILAITGNAQNYTMSDFKAVGIDGCLTKPLDFDLLVNTVKQHTRNDD